MQKSFIEQFDALAEAYRFYTMSYTITRHSLNTSLAEMMYILKIDVVYENELIITNTVNFFLQCGETLTENLDAMQVNMFVLTQGCLNTWQEERKIPKNKFGYVCICCECSKEMTIVNQVHTFAKKSYCTRCFEKMCESQK